MLLQFSALGNQRQDNAQSKDQHYIHNIGKPSQRVAVGFNKLLGLPGRFTDHCDWPRQRL